jgi:hypothetical protein
MEAVTTTTEISEITVEVDVIGTTDVEVQKETIGQKQ